MKFKKGWAEDLAEKTGRTRASIYYIARKLGKKPTIREINAIKQGRPEKY